ncbi:MAG: HD domain-containing protein [Clostridia bacterium]|nr:HD domain-containing protein [Clostridia bacterium]
MSRINRILADYEFRQYTELNAARETGRKFCNHDLKHVIDVARVTYTLFLEGLLQKEQVKTYFESLQQAREVIYAAGLLHDIGRWCEYDRGEDHAVASGQLAGPILTRAGYSSEEQQVISQAVREHRKAGNKASFLGKLLCRADKLVRLCGYCQARGECYKIDSMDTARELLLY